ncbi:MAG: phosphoribosylanthranilate isomerase [Sutterellaceae bacterium]|nr:phosphoribosylanthranilate isomerase [Sutterellaceae bacterium]MDD7441392.1 phosphoribosylanthranilate isomerase [Sutterellaceae bacterium]MDY2867890.1 phosphoribosylanthranilate isomerase [Mesosutterella sp.]
MKAKLCGMRTLDAALAAEAAGASFVGFVFWAKSRRSVTPDVAASICSKLTRVKKVGVFVDEDPDRVNEIAKECGLDLVQLHGSETADYARKIRFPVIRAFRFNEAFDARDAAAYPADFVLLDNGSNKNPGGTGKRFSWADAAKALESVPGLRDRLFVAGGIAPENVAEALSVFHPYAVDASGSLEENGEKSVERINAFMRAVRDANEAEEAKGF